MIGTPPTRGGDRMAAVQRRSTQVNELGHSTNRLRHAPLESAFGHLIVTVRGRSPSLLRQTDRPLYRQPDRETDRPTDSETDEQRGRQRDGQAREHTEREVDSETDRQGSATPSRCAVRRCAVRRCARTFTVKTGKSMDFEGSCMKTLVVSGGRVLSRAGYPAGRGDALDRSQ